MSDSEGSQEDEYEVERIVKHRGTAPDVEYLIKWVGYNDSDNTWQREEDVLAPTILSEYWERIEKERQERKASGKGVDGSTTKKRSKKEKILKVPKGENKADQRWIKQNWFQRHHLNGKQKTTKKMKTLT